jgi:teichuronic acid biosynthesis glycosyltransferase TuaH
MEPYPDTSMNTVTHSPTLLKGRDIVIVGLQPWYFPTGCNCKNIAQELALYNRVLYVNFPLKRKSFTAKQPDPKIEGHISIIKNKEKKIREISTGLWEFYPDTLIESVNWIPSTAAFKPVNYLNNRRFAKNIKEAIAELDFRDIILFNDNDIYNGFYLKELLSPSLYIYYLRDFLQGYPYWKKHTRVLEPQLIKKADLVVANSLFLAEYSAGINKHSYYIGQGCSLDHFNHTVSHQRPADIPKGFPIIGYIGALDADRLDLKIFEHIAKENPEWQVVLVGPEDATFSNSTLHDIPNIHFLGRKPFTELASYVQSFDVCMNPQLRNDITKGNYPLKIDEYLAMGKPTIATRTGAMKLFENYVYLANLPSDYPGLIKKALTENSAQKEVERISFAKSHTWENCMLELYKAITAYSKQPINVQ